MRLHAGVAASPGTRCRVLVGGYGSPACRDLDFGERFVRLAEALEWPEGVLVEDLSYSAHLVLHRLQELRPQKVVLVGAVSRGFDPPGTVRRYQLGASAADAEEVHGSLVEAIGGRVGLDNMLSVVRHFGGLPADTVVVEVEAADSSFGLGFSDEMAAAIDPLLDVVRSEVAASGLSPEPEEVPTDPAFPGIEQLFRYAEAHSQLRSLEGLSERLPAPPGVTLAARFVPGGGGLGLSGDWYDVVSLASGAIGIVVADVAGARRLHASSVTAQLKMAVQALALVEGDRPGRLVGDLARLVAATEVGPGSTIVYLTLDPANGTVRMASAGHGPPLVVHPDGTTSFLDTGRSSALGAATGTVTETVLRLPPGSTLLVFTDGLTSPPTRSPAGGLSLLQAAARAAPRDLDELCDHIVTSCVAPDGVACEDDASLIAVRVGD